MSEEKATCRGCRMTLQGKPYYMGGSAFHPRTNKRCPSNHYGGFVCSYQCDDKSSRELENDMPGSTPGGNRMLSSPAAQSLRNNWRAE